MPSPGRRSLCWSGAQCWRDDFPVSFLSRCRHIEGLLSAINQELDGVLYRRQFPPPAGGKPPAALRTVPLFPPISGNGAHHGRRDKAAAPSALPVLGVATAERKGSAISGDRGASFRTARHLHYILLCDGMGSGEEAMEESTASVRLLRGLLSADFYRRTRCNCSTASIFCGTTGPSPPWTCWRPTSPQGN